MTDNRTRRRRGKKLDRRKTYARSSSWLCWSEASMRSTMSRVAFVVVKCHANGMASTPFVSCTRCFDSFGVLVVRLFRRWSSECTCWTASIHLVTKGIYARVHCVPRKVGFCVCVHRIMDKTRLKEQPFVAIASFTCYFNIFFAFFSLFLQIVEQNVNVLAEWDDGTGAINIPWPVS